MAKTIYKISQLEEDGKTWSEEYEFAVNATNVTCNLPDNVSFSLDQFIKNLMTNAHFIHTGTKQPNSTNVKVWYDITVPEEPEDNPEEPGNDNPEVEPEDEDVLIPE